jgi:hypothetical protein
MMLGDGRRRLGGFLTESPGARESGVGKPPLVIAAE